MHSDAEETGPSDDDLALVRLDGDRGSALKWEINKLVWTYMPGSMPLGEAERIACVIFDVFRRANDGKPA